MVSGSTTAKVIQCYLISNGRPTTLATNIVANRMTLSMCHFLATTVTKSLTLIKIVNTTNSVKVLTVKQITTVLHTIAHPKMQVTSFVQLWPDDLETVPVQRATEPRP